MQVNVSEARIRLSELLRLVEEGETVIIARRGKPVAKLVPAHATGIAFGSGKSDPLVPKGDEWWQPMSDEQADAWVAGK
jgi:prevent-host-death family protein